MKNPQWKWFGDPGHFICAFDCRFHLCTQVGKYLVSTVGKYFPDEPTREIIAKSRGIELQGVGDARKQDYMDKIGFQNISLNYKYETMVFMAGEPCTLPNCNCGLPRTNGSELDVDTYNTAGEATKGHMTMCEKWNLKLNEAN